MSELTRYDNWLDDAGPAALVIREHLIPVEGPDGILFPATYAAAEDKAKFAGGYNIDTFPDGTSVCLVDSVGSQANRIEPIFATEKYAGLVPQVVVKAGEKAVNLLEAGHRAGDAIVRCSTLQKELQDAFKAQLKGNAEPLAKIAPTSLVFGVWDSRDTQAKVPRLVASTIRAFNVKELRRSAAYVPPVDHIGIGNIPDYTTEAEKAKYSERGWLQAIPSGTHGGVIATGGVRRDATLSLAALRLLAVREADGALSTDRTQALRRYILGLALTALTAPQPAYLRQGCNLVPDIDKPREFKLVHADGKREDITLTHTDALAFAKTAAEAFGVGKDQPVDFDKELAKKDVKGSGEKIQGEIVALDTEAKKFTLKAGRGKQKKDIEVSTTDATKYMKGEDESTFEAIVVQSAKVEVELTDGIAGKVTAKK